MASLAADETIANSNLDQRLVAERESSLLWSREFIELLITMFTFGLGFSTFYLLPKFLRLELHANATQIGRVVGVGQLAAVAATPVTALWLGRGARRAPAVTGLVMLSMSALAFTRVSSLGPLLLGLRAAQGFAFCLFLSAAIARAADLVPHARLAQAMGYVGLASLVTNALSPVVAEPLAATYGWSAVFLMAAAFGCCALPLARRFGEQARCCVVVPRERTAVFDRRLWTVFYATLTCGVALGVMFTFTQPMALERGALQVGRFFTGYVIGATTVRLLCSSLADRIGRRRISMASVTTYGLVVTLTLWLTPTWLLLVGLGLGVSHGLLYPALNAMALERTNARSRGPVATLFGAAFNLGYALSVLGLGVVADVVGYGPVYWGAGILSLTAVVALATID